MQVDRPGTQGVGHHLVGAVEGFGIGPVEIFGEKAVFRGVGAEKIKKRMGHIGLEPERLRPVDHLEQLEHPLPAVHSAPADFPLGGEDLVVLGGDIAGLGERIGQDLLIPLGVFRPFFHRAGGVDADTAVRADTELAKLLRRLAADANLVEEMLALLFAPDRRTRPNGGDQRSDIEPVLIRKLGQTFGLGVDLRRIEMGEVEKQIETIELHAVDLGRARHIEHILQSDTGVAPGRALADHSRPGGVVKFRKILLCLGFGFRHRKIP